MSTPFTKDLWTPRSVAETRDIYAKWADSYDADVAEAGYATPARLASALSAAVPDRSIPVLDFGCGTGLSGRALADAGFSAIDGTDISPEMIEHAKRTGVYRRLWVSGVDGDTGISPSDYPVITATGVVSLGAAPPQTLETLISLLGPGGYLAFSYNDATLNNADYMAALSRAIDGPTRLVFEEYGPHLPAKDMMSTVYLIEKT